MSSALPPISTVVDVETAEKASVALKHLLEGVEKEALTEAMRAPEKIGLALGHHLQQVERLIYKEVALLAKLAQGLDANGELAGNRTHDHFSALPEAIPHQDSQCPVSLKFCRKDAQVLDT